MDKLTEKRDRKINDYLHKASRKIIDYCLENDITKIVIVKNKNWKQDGEKSSPNKMGQRVRVKPICSKYNLKGYIEQ